MYRFKVKKPRTPKADPVLPEKTPDAEEQIGFIQGRQPGSKEEWRAAQALNKLGLTYLYQMDVGGGRDISGGQVLDFLVFTVPLPTPVFIQGKYWHTGAQGLRNTFNVARMKKMLEKQGIPCKPAVEVWDYDLFSAEAAYNTFRRLFA